MSVIQPSGIVPDTVDLTAVQQKSRVSKAGSLAAAGLAALTLSLTLPGLAVADYTLTILHTNDFHSRFEPISKYNLSLIHI